MSDHHGILTQFFLNHEVIFSSHTMLINTSTKEFALENNDIPTSHYFTYFTTRWLPMLTMNFIIFFKNKTYSILICQTFPFTLVQSFRSNRDGDVGQ